MPRCGHIALAGLPNVGKSTLLNALTGTHLAIVSPKAQATRQPVVGIRTEGDVQYVFHDLPGLLEPAYLLQERMRDLAVRTARESDVIVLLHPAADAPAPAFTDLVPEAQGWRAHQLTVYSKSDVVASWHAPEGTLAVSAESGEGIPAFLAHLASLLPERDFQYDPEDLGTQPLRFFATEFLREAAFKVLEDELPYAVVAEVDEFRETPPPVYIRATLFVERPSQKGMLIGEGGRTIKQIGQHARAQLEALIGEKTYLDLWVKVLPKWRRRTAALRRFGFSE